MANKTLEPEVFGKIPEYISTYEKQMVEFVFVTSACFLVGVLGSVGNILNIVVFSKQHGRREQQTVSVFLSSDLNGAKFQGFHETVNISFLSLSVADLLNLLPLTWTSFFVYNPFNLWHIETQEFNVYYVISTFPREIFTRISRWVKVYINIERFVSILSPMKVKEYFTKTTTVVVMTSIFSLYVIEMPIFYQCVRIVALTFPPLNKSVLYLSAPDVCNYGESISIAFHALSIICPCVLDLVTASLIVYQLRNTNQWRSRSLTNERMQLMTSRDLKLIKMILTLAVVFVLTTLPMWMTYVMSLIERLAFFTGYLGNISFYVMFSVSTFFETVGSSINVFIYYNMSSKYKQVFLALWCVRCREKKTGHN